MRWGCPSTPSSITTIGFKGRTSLPTPSAAWSACASALGMVPVFAPPREPGFPKLPSRISMGSGKPKSGVASSTSHSPTSVPTRPVMWRPDATARPLAMTAHRHARRFRHHGPSICKRHRADESCSCVVPASTAPSTSWATRFQIDSLWCHRLVRCELLLEEHCIQFYGLRRAQPDSQPLLREAPYTFPNRRFKE